MPSKTEALEETDAEVVDINREPGKLVAGRDQKGMMIVVPSLTAGQRGST
jgi:hypothetical protein